MSGTSFTILVLVLSVIGSYIGYKLAVYDAMKDGLRHDGLTKVFIVVVLFLILAAVTMFILALIFKALGIECIGEC